MISQTSRYALNILGYLVRHRDRRTRGEEIARSTGIPANYLSKILNQLRKQGLVDSEKGWGGGFQLRPGAGKQPIGDVLAIFEGAESLVRKDCVFGFPTCDEDDPCPLHPHWEKIRSVLSHMMKNTTIQDLGDGAG